MTDQVITVNEANYIDRDLDYSSHHKDGSTPPRAKLVKNLWWKKSGSTQ